MTALLEVESLAVHHRTSVGLFAPPRTLRAVDGVSLSLREGETLGLVGESGCGKSTLARAVLQLQRPTAGSVRWRGRELTTLSERELRPLRRELQVVFQDPYAALNPRMTLGEALSEPLDIHRLHEGRRAERLRELAAMVGLREELLSRTPDALSGGQRQRACIARALAVEPRLLVLDEPVSALDVSVQAQVLNLLVDLQQRLGLSYLFISHDLRVVEYVSDRVAVMYLGRIVETGPREALFRAPQHPYTQALLAAGEAKVSGLEGEAGDASSAPGGCSFAPRCPMATERCRAEAPALAGDGHLVACHRAEECAGFGASNEGLRS
ncbi:MAG: Oligopeptide transport ATP-binding protein OppF [Pseudomonadota bacterium]|jgi:oligopeptide/dipeptide ABC transporter ATP-binding protein